MKISAFFFLALLVSSQASANLKVFKQIMDEGQFGNGGASVRKYNTDLSKAELVAAAKKELKAEYWEGCGPWKVNTNRRPAIKLIDKLEEGQQSSAVVKKLESLYENDEIVAIVSAQSNNEIECSLFWFNVYGADGHMIALRYNMGD